MRRNLLLFLVCTVIFIFISIHARAQVEQGGFGSVYTGPFYQINASLQKDLSSDKLMGKAFKGNLLVANWGVEGFTIWKQGFLLGANVNYSTATSRSEGGSVTQNTTGLFASVGYRLINTKRWLGFTYWGIGGFGASFKIANYGPQTFVVDKDSIIQGQSRKYNAAGMAFDFGFALKYLVTNYTLKNFKKLKPMIGLNTGVSFFPAFQKWQSSNSDARIESFNTPFIMAIYARVTLGLGVFTDKEK
jgi:hypothetical protein